MSLWKSHRPLLLLMAGIGVLHLVTMPRFFYPGDNFIPRAEAANLVAGGGFGIGYDKKGELGGFLQERGQYFYENDVRGRLFSKYGIAYTALYIPPLFAEKLARGKLGILEQDESRLVFMNIYQVVLALAAVAYLFALAGLYTGKTWVRIAFVLCSCYGTFLWYYMRAPALEILQMVPFLGFFYHSVVFLRGPRTRVPASRDGLGAERDRSWLHLLAASCCSGVLVLTKVSFALLPASLAFFAASSRPVSEEFRIRLRYGLVVDRQRHLKFFVAPLLVFAAILLLGNYARFGSPIETGYGQWRDSAGRAVDRLGFEFFSQASRGYFVRLGNTNAFIHYPLVLLAFFGVRRFVRKFPRDFAFLCFVVLGTGLLMCFYSVWCGGWCYGPRYLLFALVVGSLPFIETLDILAGARCTALKIAGGLTAGLVLLWSFNMQVSVNSMHYFTWHYLSGMFAQFKDERISAYFDSTIHWGLVNRDLRAHLAGKREFYPVTRVMQRVPPEMRSRVAAQFQGPLTQLARSNYMLFP